VIVISHVKGFYISVSCSPENTKSVFWVSLVVALVMIYPI